MVPWLTVQMHSRVMIVWRMFFTESHVAGKDCRDYIYKHKDQSLRVDEKVQTSIFWRVAFPS